MASTPRSSELPPWIDAGVAIGEIFVDKYRVDAILGHGGMGVVALCTHLALNERVAIKMLRRDVLDDADAVERFMREAQAASKLKSEFVARVTDVGRSKANVPYMVMEYLEGHDLDELLDERGTISRRWAIEMTLQACDALAEAHSIGIVHRDVKPSNLFVTWRPDGSALVKVLDFGISKALTGDAMRLTQTQSLLGTPAYMSPEQMRSARTVDARTDIWSLGTVLYEMLEGRRPFEAESFSEMCIKVAVDPPGAMPNTPPALQHVVLRCLAKLPDERYPSMAALGRDLVPFSHDPHHAQLLAERMARTLRRSRILDQDLTRSDIPASVRDVPSAERRAHPAAVTPLSNPESAPPRANRAPTATSPLTETYVVRRPKRWGTLAAAAALTGAALVGIALSRARDPRSSSLPPASAPPTAAPAPSALGATAPGAAPLAVDGASAPNASPALGPATQSSAGSSAQVPTAIHAADPAVPPSRSGDRSPPRTQLPAAQPPRPAAVHSSQPETTRSRPGSPIKPAVRSPASRRPDRNTPPGTPSNDTAPDCDPFAQPHAANACPPRENPPHKN